MTYLRILALLVVVSVCGRAIAADPYTIEGVKVSSSGSSAKQAKDAAVLAGQREAFTKLVERLTSGPADPSLVSMDADKLAELVQGIEVDDEKITATYYKATMSITFNHAMVDNLLKNRSASISPEKKSAAATIVLVPVLVGPGSGAFEADNPLRSSLAKASSVNHGANFIVLPSLRSVDKSKITQNIEGLDHQTKDALLQIGQTYNADKLVLIVAVKDMADAGKVNVRLMDIKDPDAVIREMSFKASDLQPGEDVFAAAARSITGIFAGTATKSNVENVIPGSAPTAKITVTVPIASLQEWAAIRKKLEGLDFIKDLTVQSLTVKYAVVDMSYRDTFENLAAKMGENGFVLENTGNAMVLHVKTQAAQ